MDGILLKALSWDHLGSQILFSLKGSTFGMAELSLMHPFIFRMNSSGSKALHRILFEEAVTLPRKEMDDLKERLGAYVHGKKAEFVPLDVLLGNAQGDTAQKSHR